MSYKEEDLKQAIKYVSSGPPIKGITNEVKLTFYGLFKQASAGPCKSPEPSRFQIVKRAQWQAWKKHGDMSKEEAAKQYILELEKLVPDWRKSKL